MNSKKSPWPIRDIIFGISIPILFLILGYVFNHLDQIRYRPWLVMPLSFTLLILNFISLILYSIYIFRKHNYDPHYVPLIIPLPFSKVRKVLKELLSSFFIFLLIGLIIGLIAKLISILLKTRITTPEVWEWATYAPNSNFLILVFIISFTVGPVCEEIFFRGFLYNAMKTRTSVVVAAIFQAALFAVLHRYDLLNRFVVFLTGIALVIVYEKRKNLLSPIFIHAMKNAVWCLPLLVLTLQNFHTPAANWEEAKIQPDWLKAYPPAQVTRQKEGMHQWQYAIDKWGSKGSKKWKKEANAFYVVHKWFPEDKTACAKAKLGIVVIYFNYLRDYRRAIIEADSLLFRYPEQREQCALALTTKGWCYYFLRDFENSRIAFNNVVDNFRQYNDAFESAQKGIEMLNILESK